MTSRRLRRRIVAALLAVLCLPQFAVSAPLAMADDATAGYRFARPVPPKPGDTPAEFSAIVRASQQRSASATGPAERTLVRDADQTLPIALAALAVVLALVGLGTALAGRAQAPRPGRSH